MNFDIAIVKGRHIDHSIRQDPRGCLEIVRQAYVLHERGETINPDSYFLRFDHNPKARIIALPAHVGGSVNLSGIKWIASFPSNVSKGFPRASAVLILNDAETGYPVALLESAIISATRTAASAVLAAEALHPTPRRAKTIGFVGAGLIARHIMEMFRQSGWEFDQVACYDHDIASAEAFLTKCASDLPSRRCESAEQLAQECDLIVFATTAPSPYFEQLSALRHCPTILNISLRDLAPSLLDASYNVVDDVEHVMKADTSPHLLEQQRGDRSFVDATIGQVLQGEWQPPATRDRPTIFSPFGLGVLDIALGYWAWQQAAARGDDVLVLDDFFFELER